MGRGQGELLLPLFLLCLSMWYRVTSFAKSPDASPFSRTAPIWMAGVSKYFVDESGKVIKHVIDPLPEKA